MNAHKYRWLCNCHQDMGKSISISSKHSLLPLPAPMPFPITIHYLLATADLSFTIVWPFLDLHMDVITTVYKSLVSDFFH